MDNIPSNTSNRFELLLDSSAVLGSIESVSGGNIKGEVTSRPQGMAQPKHISRLIHEPVSFEVGMEMAPRFYKWLESSLKEGPVCQTVAIADRLSGMVRSLVNAHIAEVQFPSFEAENSTPGLMGIKLESESIDLSQEEMPLGDMGATAQVWLGSNFRLHIGDLPCNQVKKIDSFTWSQSAIVNEERVFGKPIKSLEQVSVPNLRLTLPMTELAPWQDWFEQLLNADGSEGEGELNGSLEFMSNDGEQTLASLDLSNLGIVGLEILTEDETVEGEPCFCVELYCEQICFNYEKRLIYYNGDCILLMEQDANGFGPGAIIHFDLDGDGEFEQQVKTDENNFYTFSIDVTQLPESGIFTMFTSSADGTQESEIITVCPIQEKPFNPATEIAEKLTPEEPEICTSCTSCSSNDTLWSGSLDGYNTSNTPTANGVELATGKLRQSWPITSFDTRMLGFGLNLHHVSMMDYAGPYGQSGSHSFNMMIVQTGEFTGTIITPDLRCYEISSEDGLTWLLPDGFTSQLTLDPESQRWIMTHYSGLKVTFFQGLMGQPGYPMSIQEPNGNTTHLGYDTSGLLRQIVTDLGQVQTFGYNEDCLLVSFTDHLGRTWTFSYDEQGRLTTMETPITEYADIPAGFEITDEILPEVLVTQTRKTTLAYTDQAFPHHITSITDQRGAVPQAWQYDSDGRVNIATINGQDVRYDYEPEDDPQPLVRLEETNLLTRVTDREGNVTDYEIHGEAGGPVDGLGQYGIRRMITWTESGKGNALLRQGEPDYWEQRWLQKCHCLIPDTVTQPFSSEDANGLEFDDNGIPVNWPRDIYTYNANHQVVRHQYTDGTDTIQTESTYQEFSFGENGQYSRLINRTDSRAFDINPIYEGLNFIHTYEYDKFGNRIRHNAPTVTRGVNEPQLIAEIWTYNQFGQVLSETDPNGNITTYTYFEGMSQGGNINTKGRFGGYLASMTRGATGSADAVTNLTQQYRVNALGMTTQEIDSKGFVYDFEFNNLGESTREIEPTVTLRNGTQVRYETRHIYDGAGNEVMHRRSNIDFDGTVSVNAFIDRSMSYDAVNNLLSSRVEVDEDEANDLITRYAYDNNDDQIITQKPEGNREFMVYDERRLSFKTFYGVAPGATVEEGYPADKRAENLGSTAFVGLTITTYDARQNTIRTRDGRGNNIDSFYDFYNRQIAESDQNGNGWVREYDDASNVLTTEGGAVDKNTGAITLVLERSYSRFDEVRRQYQTVQDIDLATDERGEIDPAGSDNSSYQTIFDAGSRVVRSLDANGNPSDRFYDAANRTIRVKDALNNEQFYTYDANSNVILISETEVPSPGATGTPEIYQTTNDFDELNRQVEEHIRGLNGNSIDHTNFMAYDSRSNTRLVQDAEDNYTLNTYDDLDREILMQRFNGDPATGTPTELLHYEYAYDGNSRKTEDRALSDVTDLNSLQVTRYAYDDLDRLVRTVYPDSDDPIDGSNNGANGIFDRVEMEYDANSNPVRVTEQRGVVFNNTFDPGNRQIEQNIDLPAEVPGITQQTYTYDALNRTTSANNNYAQVEQEYDAFSRLIQETQSIRLDGSGLSNGYEQPVQVISSYDKQSNRIACTVVEGTNTDLAVANTYDALNRMDVISAAYFNQPNHLINQYAYIGPGRIQSKTLGNGAKLTETYDVKRRIQSHQWRSTSGSTLVGFEYDYDRMDNVLFERFNHDGNRYDHFGYNDRYEVTSVEYRSPNPTPPANPSNTFDYDDLFNRRQANFGDPFNANPNTVDSYGINKANEYTQITRNSNPITLNHDRAGNMTQFPVRPVTENGDQQDVTARARWDAVNLLFDIETGVNPQQHYRYDPFRRRIVTLELSGSDISQGSRRYIYDGWTVLEERLFDASATLGSAPSTLERIYINGQQIDEPLLVAIDRNGDGELGNGNPKNERDINADQEYYYLCNRLGNVMGLLDVDNVERILEYYRYSIYGEPTVLPLIDEDGDGLEDTPLNLSDNFTQNSLLVSAFSNIYLFTARRFDWETGLYYFRVRYFDAAQGRFVSRDPLGYEDSMGLYDYVSNASTVLIDPLGLKEKPPKGTEPFKTKGIKSSDMNAFLQEFPNLQPDEFNITNLPISKYNCFALTCGRTDTVIDELDAEKFGDNDGYLSEVEDWDAFYKNQGYTDSKNCKPECRKRKVAIFGSEVYNRNFRNKRQGQRYVYVKHAAIETMDGDWWESKLGKKGMSIIHHLKQLESQKYGQVIKCYEKKQNNANVKLCPCKVWSCIKGLFCGDDN